MADVRNEIESVRDFVAPLLPGVSFMLQNIPERYKKDVMTIDLQRSKSATETNASYRLDRTIQLVYFGANAADCLTKMARIEQALNNAQLIPINGTSRYLSIGSFSLSNPFKTDTTGVFAVIGMLEVSLRELRPQPTYDKIENVYADVNGMATQAPCNKNLKE